MYIFACLMHTERDHASTISSYLDRDVGLGLEVRYPWTVEQHPADIRLRLSQISSLFFIFQIALITLIDNGAHGEGCHSFRLEWITARQENSFIRERYSRTSYRSLVRNRRIGILGCLANIDYLVNVSLFTPTDGILIPSHCPGRGAITQTQELLLLGVLR
jgi:hypothetical protein